MRLKIYNKVHAGDHNVNRIAQKLYKKGNKVQIRLEVQKTVTYQWSSQHFIVDQVQQSSYRPGYKRTMVDPRTGEALPNLYQKDQLQKWIKPTREAFFTDDQVLINYIGKPVREENGVTERAPGDMVSVAGQKKWMLFKRDDLKRDIPRTLNQFERKHDV